jgi:alpha-glucosidase
MHINRYVAIAALGFLAQQAMASADADYSVSSPDGSISIALQVGADGPPRYEVTRRGETVIAPSQLRLQLMDDRGFERFDAVSSQRRSVDEQYRWIVGKTSQARDRFNEVTVSLQERGGSARRLELILRAYDDGAALRYFVPSQRGFDELALRAEATEFAFAGDYECHGLNIGHMYSSHEGEFDPVLSSRIREHHLFDLPLSCRIPSGRTQFVIAEADLHDYAGMYLSGRGNGEPGVVTRLARHPTQATPVVRVKSSDRGIASPWRVIMMADTLGKLIESTLIANLNPPTALRDTSWIVPGKSAWDWWSGPHLPPPAKAGMDMPTLKRYIDFAAAARLEYMLIDEGWCLNSGVGGVARPDADITRTKPGIDMQELVRYAAQRNVGLWLWVQWALLDRQMEAALAQYRQWGIKGIKIDFMDRNDQQMVDYYHRVMSKAAEQRLMVDMHGAYPPTGLYRTYPNYMTQEGVMGAEYNKWSRRVTATHNVTLPYTRMLLGPIDYTPGGFRNVRAEEFRINNSPPFVQTTRGQALAMFVVYDSPLQMVADSPDAYENAAGFDFVQDVPTSWDETRFLEGTIAEYIVLARRKGSTWYIGAMTNEASRDLTVPLDFLGPGNYRSRVWQDGATPQELRHHDTQVTRADKLTLKLAPGGGAVAVLKHGG